MGHEYAHPIGGPFEGHKEIAWCVSFSSGGRRVISGSTDEAVRTWNADTHEQIGEAYRDIIRTFRDLDRNTII